MGDELEEVVGLTGFKGREVDTETHAVGVGFGTKG